ncbi:septation ring formation regulator EzrA [Ligilactobacillus animalis]|uniref:septation ring formation regulator EzrA n=1 Tax=Ligilactobacillus animalis TaxID=1605 RepID=UPI0010A57E7D|nr:septation ring formation regulator EzrA [Ligilactobacillus animalis]MDO5883266.1 septation ring formation regulator EzrA [Ligilactobacillus animalis]MDU8986189.1 septation ring formation regulator EzrA [Ligilactobacillus animalis]THE21672.1 septation ring formation regulator EzrA [Ligilactobacillus animalis]THE22266.1 septation ring formation regulator EzrA [Ligilactobacillus animalis]
MVVVLVTIVLVAVAIYASVLFFQRSFEERITKAKSSIEEILDSPLEKELEEVKKMTLSGDSLSEFEAVEHSYYALVNQQLPEISEYLNKLQAELEQYRFWKINGELKQNEAQVAKAQQQYEQLKLELAEIKQTAEIHKKAIGELKEEYQKIRKTLLAKNFSYGPSIDELEKELATLEKDFHEYSKVTEEGDYAKSSELLEKLKQQTRLLKIALKKLPPIYRNLKNIFPEQLQELKAGYSKLQAEKYGFKKDLAKHLEAIEQKCKENEANLKQADVPKAEALDQQIADMIDEAYEIMENEYNAKLKVTRQEKHLADFIEHAKHQEKELLIELDRLSQNYTLNHNEMEEAHALNEQLKKIDKNFTAYMQAKPKDVIVYSEVLEQQTADLEALKKIELKQKEIGESVADLFEEEKEAQAAVQGFDNDIHRLKREIEILNLPGLPSDYIEYFFKVGREIESLDQDLNKIQIDMEQIARDLINTQSDLDVLAQKTQEIIDSSTLTEAMLQYSNRYRTRYPEVASAYAHAVELFNKNYDYMGALDVISEALETVEPGCYKRIENDYKAGNNRREVI